MNKNEFENWVRQQREQVIQYLQDQDITHNGVGTWPAFEIAPYFAIWAVKSRKFPGQVGWWAFSGDIPTDYISGHNLLDPRAALGDLLKTWQEYIPYLKRGEPPPGIKVGNAKNREELGDLLERRIRLLKESHEDDALWAEIFKEATSHHL
ncbi:MAG: DUF4826 family protein [Blastocatellia bacterium]|nr:DUF4826 family protein [Blastocatellia bacterium]